MKEINKILDVFLISEEEYFEALENGDIEKINLITQSQERKNIKEFENQVHDYLIGKENARYMDHELPIILNFINNKEKLIPISDFEYEFEKFQKSKDKELSLIIHENDHYYHISFIKNVDNSITLITNDSLNRNLCSKNFQEKLLELKEEKNINFKVNVDASKDKLIQRNGYECGPCSLYNSNKEFFDKNLSINHKSVDLNNEQNYKNFFKKLYLSDYLLFHASIIYQVSKEKFKDKINNKSFDLIFKEKIVEYITKNAISKFIDKILAFDTKKLTREIFEGGIDTFDTTLKTFIDKQLEDFYKHAQNQANSNSQNQSDKRKTSEEEDINISIGSSEILANESKKTKS